MVCKSVLLNTLENKGVLFYFFNIIRESIYRTLSFTTKLINVLFDQNLTSGTSFFNTSFVFNTLTKLYNDIIHEGKAPPNRGTNKTSAVQ